MNHLSLRYGCNPHQKDASVSMKAGELPLKVLNGAPGYINMLDALLAWQFVKELKSITNKPAAASFKHLSPAGAALAKPLSPKYLQSQFITQKEFSPIATAYIRARGGDRMCAFGDAAAVSEEVDVTLANILKQEVSDLIIAPSYSVEALEILKKKKKGNFLVLQIDPNYEPSALETREFYGITFQQERNTAVINSKLFNNCVTDNNQITPEIMETLILATIALKYTQSNSVTVAYDGQLIGVGAGQQSRVHCLRLACSKADKWFMQQHPDILDLQYKDGFVKPEKANIVDQLLLWDELSNDEKQQLSNSLLEEPPHISSDAKSVFIKQHKGVCLSSDAFFPFRDNIDRASRTNIGIVAHPGGSLRDSDCIKAANEYGIVMYHTGLRLFTH